VTFEEYTHHGDWSLTVGWRRTRQTIRPKPKRSSTTGRRMTRSLLAGKAVAGIVNAADREHLNVVTTNCTRRRAAGRAV
jgi:hypothetical protein